MPETVQVFNARIVLTGNETSHIKLKVAKKALHTSVSVNFYNINQEYQYLVKLICYVC